MNNLNIEIGHVVDHAALARLAVPELQATDPELQHTIDAIGPFTCPLPQLAGLVEAAAGDDFARGWLCGILAVRHQINLILGPGADGGPGGGAGLQQFFSPLTIRANSDSTGGRNG